ncbi:MAG TPA: site-specific integrase [Pelobium sp.]|nr:site-specific integrase [Pelobium sp.]
MRTTLSLLFALRKPKNYLSGEMPIYLRVTVDGRRTELAVGRKCDPTKWDSVKGRAIGSKAILKTLNAFLDDVQFKFLELHRRMSEADECITVETLKNRFIGKSEKVRTLLFVFEEHNQKMKSLVGQEFEKSTLQRYETALMHTRDFMKWKYNISDIPVSKINFEFLNEFEYYLRSVRNCANNSAIKYIKNLGKIVRICLGNGWLTADPYINYKPKTTKVHRVVLNKDDLTSIAEKNFSIERLDQVRDIFLFSCYTGLAYVDVKKLKRSEIEKGIDGKLWIYTHRQKTDSLSRIPLLPMALSIIQKYEDHPQCIAEDLLLPVISNQKMNAYLKEIADVCGIDKLLTFHIARHTFATTVTLNNGVPIETVAKMMGHSSIKTTQIYAKVLDHKISDDMEILRKKLG